jgi:polyhydroxyalkanoate synthesis repressor PhaR
MEPANRKLVIKKYSDRRLYDSSARRYVNLEDIGRLIREGADVEVRDARTGKDLTRMVLTQIIVEDARDEETALPMKLLRQLVLASDRATHDFLSWYLETAFDLYQKAGSALRTRVSEARLAVTSPVEYLRNLLSGQPRAPEPDPGELEELRRRIQELEARLSRPARRRSRKT